MKHRNQIDSDDLNLPLSFAIDAHLTQIGRIYDLLVLREVFSKVMAEVELVDIYKVMHT